MTDYMKFLPLAIIAAGLVASATTAQMQIGSHEGELWDLSEGVDENEEDIELIQRELIARQGETRLQVQRIENEQRSQGQDLEKILLLLQQAQN
jgi:hypothetical protein